MALQRTKLADIQYVPSSAGSLFSNPSGAKTYVRSLTLFNGGSSVETVRLYNVPDNASAVGTSGPSNQFLQQNLQAKETLVLEFGFPIVLSDQNDSIQGSTTTGSTVTVMIHGDQE